MNVLRRLAAVLALVFVPSASWAVTCTSFPYTLTNGQTADANQVMANFNNLLTCNNTLLAPLTSPTFAGTVTMPDGSTWTSAGLSNIALNGTVTGTYTLAGTVTIDTPSILSPTFTGTMTMPDASTWSASGLNNVVLAGTATGTYTLGGTPTLISATIDTPTMSGEATGTYTLAGTVTIDTPTIVSPTFTGTITGLPPAGLNLIGSYTAPASETAVTICASGCSITSALPNTYAEYEIHLINVVPATNNVGLEMQFSTNGGSSYDTGASSYAYQILSISPTGAAALGATGAAFLGLTYPGQGIPNSAPGYSGTVKLRNPAAGYVVANMSDIEFFESGSLWVSNVGGGAYLGSSSAVNGVKLLMSSGNIAAGSQFILYGITQ